MQVYGRWSSPTRYIVEKDWDIESGCFGNGVSDEGNKNPIIKYPAPNVRAWTSFCSKLE